MSFLYRTIPVARTAIRPSSRAFTTSIIQQKSATETVKDGLKAVDRTVSDAAVAGIDKGVEIKDKVAAKAPGSAEEAKGQASKLAGQAQGEASKVAGQAKGKAEELKGQAKSKM